MKQNVVKQWPQFPAHPLPADIAMLPTLEAEPWLKIGEGGELPSLEGPVFDREGNFYVCHNVRPQTEILKISPDKEVETFRVCHAAMPVGLAVHKDGRIFGADLHGSIIVLSPDGELLRQIPAEYNGELLASDDLAFDKNGDLYITDFRGSHIDPIGGVYCLRAETDYKELELVTQGISSANGISFSPEYDIMWIGETGRNTVLRMGKGRDGTFKPGGVNTKIVYTGTGQAMADSNKVDAQGNVYQAMMFGGRILILNKEGVPIANVLVPGREQGKHLATPNLAICPGKKEGYMLASGPYGAWIFRFPTLAESALLYSHM